MHENVVNDLDSSANSIHDRFSGGLVHYSSSNVNRELTSVRESLPGKHLFSDFSKFLAFFAQESEANFQINRKLKKHISLGHLSSQICQIQKLIASRWMSLSHTMNNCLLDCKGLSMGSPIADSRTRKCGETFPSGTTHQ